MPSTRSRAASFGASRDLTPRVCFSRENTRNRPPGAACAAALILAIIGFVSNGPLEALRADDLPSGRMTCVELGGRRILVANVDGIFYATDDSCTHEEASLSHGSLKGDLVKCPLHGSRFSLRTGEPLEDPAEAWLRCYPVSVENGAVLVDLDSEIRR
jgi:3-phenylpropionate/trans-cinnamate dioxygenase ferredoxin component